MNELRIAMQLSTAFLRIRNDSHERELARAVRPLRPKRPRMSSTTMLDRYEALIRRLKAGQESAR